MGWVLPTSYADSGSVWDNETLAYNNNTADGANCDIPNGGWTGFLELNHSSIPCSVLRFYATTGGGGITGAQIDIDAYYGGAWHNVYQGTFTYSTYVEKSLGATYNVTAMRIRMYNGTASSPLAMLILEAHFYQVVAPTVTTQACTAVTGQAATGNGNITALGGENATRRGFCYMAGTSGDPTTANSVVYDDGSFSTGAYTKGITGLSPSTGYRVRAYAVNSIGTSYGTTVQLTTDSPPTVTTQAVSAIGSVTATGNGNITALGGETPTKRGVCYNTTGSPTTADDIFEEDGSFGTGAFTASMTGLSPGVKYYVKAYAISSAGTGYGAEVNFTTDKVAPTVTTQDPTDVLPTTVTGNGNITALGGENATVRGFKYGLTQVDTWSVSDSGSFSAGAFTKGLTGLTANTTYWIRAYATNSIGTSYGAWVEFQTAAQGTIPTGTKIELGSDYSGYSYGLQESETDDGSAYTAYFVISTDLSNKQALAFYKRILDLHLYFKSQATGTATITVKRDNEADWQAVGSVSLTGTADIIVPHLACRIYGKHFLFRISATNAFQFLGCLFQYLPGGLR